MKGVYAIIDKASNRYYIGSSKNIKVRWYHHRTALRAGTHGNKFLQRAFDKRGEDNLFFLVLEQCDDLLTVEQRYIDEMFMQKRCMNGRKTASLGGMHKGRAKTAKEKANMSAAQKGKPRTHKKREWTPEQRKALSDRMKERHKLGLVNTGYNQYKPKNGVK